MKDFSSDLENLRHRLNEASKYLNVASARGVLRELEVEVARPDLWDDQDNAKKINAEYASVKSDLDDFDQLSNAIDDLDLLHQLAREADDASQEPDLENGVAGCGAQLNTLEVRSMFTGEHDECDAILHINAKDGGVDAQDWTEMLLRMYRRWAELNGFGFEIEDLSKGTEAGILSVEVIVRGRNAYGLLTSERGIHRLVRISPFDNQGRRHTSFALVQVWPILDQAELEIDEKEIRMEVFRASGAGGQHVNKTSSAVRLTHEPTGLVTSSQQERSQLQNRENAMKRLVAMIIAQDEEQRAAALDQIVGKQAQVGWGSQMRSYVLQPYQLVKDLRSNFETGNVTAVLDGEVNQFMEGFLRWRRSEIQSASETGDKS